MSSSAIVPTSRAAPVAPEAVGSGRMPTLTRSSSAESTTASFHSGTSENGSILPICSPQSRPMSMCFTGPRKPRASSNLTKPCWSAARASFCIAGSSVVRTVRPPS